jgi:hypothetical protein
MMDFELWILDSFSIFLRFEISEPGGDAAVASNW